MEKLFKLSLLLVGLLLVSCDSLFEGGSYVHAYVKNCSGHKVYVNCSIIPDTNYKLDDFKIINGLEDGFNWDYRFICESWTDFFEKYQTDTLIISVCKSKENLEQWVQTKEPSFCDKQVYFTKMDRKDAWITYVYDGTSLTEKAK